MFNIKPDSNAANRDQEFRDATIALTSWFIVNNLRTRIPIIDPILAKIYFDTYAIPIGENIDNIKEAASEYEPDIIRFFLLNQRQRCENIVANISKIFMNANIVLPIQCKPFFEEMINLSENIGQHNIQTKETQVLDSLRDTIIANSIDQAKSAQYVGRIDVPQHIPVKTAGKYILTDGEKGAYIFILIHALNKLYLPMFAGRDRNIKPNVYALTDMYEDSGTRFAKIVEYLKSALFMICISHDDRFNAACCGWLTPSIVPSIQDDMFSVVKTIAGRCRVLEGYYDSINKECARYGGFTIPQAICLPTNTTARLECFKPEKNAISLTYKFLVCQSFLSLLDYNNTEINNA